MADAKSDRRAVACAVLIAGAYALARHFIYRAMPAPDFDAWNRRDLVMTLPRLAGFAACVAVMARLGGGRRAWGWTWTLTPLATVPLALIGAVEIVGHLSVGSSTTLSAGALLAGWLATGAVALFEEAAMRSLMYLPLRRLVPPWIAGVLCGAAFVLYHFEAHSLARAWPHLFAFGIGACAAVELGAGLGWLVALHWFVDGVWYHFSAGDGDPVAYLARPILIAFTIVVSLLMLVRRAKR